MSEKDGFVRAVESAFQFLTAELGFGRASVAHDRQGIYEYTTVRYENDYVTVKIEAGWHHRDSYLKTILYPRAGFSIPVHSRKSGQLLHIRDGFSVEELAEALAPFVKIPEKRAREELVRIHAGVLDRHGRDILRGDVASFPQIKGAARRNIVKTDPNWMP